MNTWILPQVVSVSTGFDTTDLFRPGEVREKAPWELSTFFLAFVPERIDLIS
jgi:hypothetical protein